MRGGMQIVSMAFDVGQTDLPGLRYCLAQGSKKLKLHSGRMSLFIKLTYEPFLFGQYSGRNNYEN